MGFERYRGGSEVSDRLTRWISMVQRLFGVRWISLCVSIGPVPMLLEGVMDSARSHRVAVLFIGEWRVLCDLINILIA